MKHLAALFASISLLAAVCGFGLNVIPIIANCGKIAAGIALLGFAVTAALYVLDELIPPLAFDASDIHV